MSNFVFQFYHPDGKGGIRPLVASTGNDLKEAFVAASRKAISLFGRPGGVLGVVHTTEEVIGKTDAEIKQIFDTHVLHPLGFNVTPDLLEKINAPLPVGDQASTVTSTVTTTATMTAAAVAPAATASAAPAKPARSRRGGNANLPKPVTADSVIEDDPERDQGKEQFANFVRSAISQYHGQEITAELVSKLKDSIVSVVINNCPNVQDLTVSVEGQLVKVASSLGKLEAELLPNPKTESDPQAGAAIEPVTPVMGTEGLEKPAAQ